MYIYTQIKVLCKIKHLPGQCQAEHSSKYMGFVKIYGRRQTRHIFIYGLELTK